MSYEIILYTLWAVVCVILAIIMYKVLKRNLKSKVNQFFSMAISFGIIGVIIDFIKTPMLDPNVREIATLLNKFSLFFSAFAMAFLLIVLLYLYKNEVIAQIKYQFIVILIYGAVLSILFFIPDGIILEEQSGSTFLVSVYSLELMLYIVSILTLSIIVTFWLYKNLSSRFKDALIKKRFKCFIAGDCILYYSPIGICIVNYINIPIVRDIFTYTVLIMFLGLGFVYYGIASGFRSSME